MIDGVIDILGTKYNYKSVKNEDFPKGEENQDGGITKFYEKQIILNENEEIKDYNRIFRHEILHAFLFECGLSEYTQNEQLIDFLAYQIPKLVKIYNQLGVME